MPVRVPYPCTSLKGRFYKKITLALLFILPVRLSRVFVSISLITLLLGIKDQSLNADKAVMEKAQRMLRVHLSDDILLLPQETLHWYWSSDVLQRCYDIGSGQVSLYTLISDETLFKAHRTFIVDTLLEALPASLKMKLQLGTSTRTSAIRSDVLSVVGMACA